MSLWIAGSDEAEKEDIADDVLMMVEKRVVVVKRELTTCKCHQFDLFLRYHHQVAPSTDRQQSRNSE